MGRNQENIRVNWGVRADTQVKIKQIMASLYYGSNGDVVDRAVAELHARLFSEPNQSVTVDEALRASLLEH